MKYKVAVGFCYEPPGQTDLWRDVREGELVDDSTFPVGDPPLPWTAWTRKNILIPETES